MAYPAQHSYIMRAEGNLTYPQFIQAVEHMWKKTNPNVPIISQGVSTESSYPCIVVGVENKLPHPQEPKPKLRETVKTTEDTKGLMIYGQRFNYAIKFAVMAQVQSDGSQMADQIMENFEDFMLRFTPVLKRLGASDIFYGRRLPDSEESRSGDGVVKRSVLYQVTLEKIIHRDVDKLERVYVEVADLLTLEVTEDSPGPNY